MTPVSQRTRVIPITAWVIASLVFLVMSLLMIWIISQNSGIPLAVRILLPVMPPFLLGALTLLIGYVYGDARRRGMRYVLWTLLAIFIPDGIGVILYFILRDPMPSRCPKCGASTKQGYAFCPVCGAGILPACSQCHRAGQPGWSHCAWCGAKV
jgi:RNA polymerase subunit RPABC4/transcription elongation factor Spt4